MYNESDGAWPDVFRIAAVIIHIISASGPSRLFAGPTADGTGQARKTPTVRRRDRPGISVGGSLMTHETQGRFARCVQWTVRRNPT
jgi:hypothetical protein